MASGSDDERVDVPTDEYGIIYTREANIEAGRDVDFGHKRITLERHETFMRVRRECHVGGVPTAN